MPPKSNKQVAYKKAQAAKFRPSPRNIPSVVVSPKKRFTIECISTDQNFASAVLTYNDLYHFLEKQLFEAVHPPIEHQSTPVQFIFWKHIRLVGVDAWGATTDTTGASDVSTFGLRLLSATIAQVVPPTVQIWDQTAGADERPFASLRATPLHWSNQADSATPCIEATTCAVLHVHVEVW